MKNISKLFFASMIITLMFSCENIDNPSPINTIDESRTATIKGFVTADIDLTNSDNKFPPAGTKVFVVVDSRDYATRTASGTYQELRFETTLNEVGEFEIAVPALAKSISADIEADDFVFDQVIVDPDDNTKSTTRKRLFFRADDDISFTEGTTSFVRLSYSNTSFE